MIDQALIEIREEMAKLVAWMVAKGHSRATAELRIEPSRPYEIRLSTGGEKAIHWWEDSAHTESFAYVHGDDFKEAIANAVKTIGRMEPSVALACAAWFTTEAA